MKTVLLLLVLTFLCFGITEVSAQKKTKPKEVIFVELTVTRRSSPQTIEIPINVNVSRGKEKPLKAGWAKKGDGALPPQYSFNLEAYLKDKNSSDVYLEIIVEGCQTIVRKQFIVSKTQKTELETECEIKVVAYYNTESKKKHF